MMTDQKTIETYRFIYTLKNLVVSTISYVTINLKGQGGVQHLKRWTFSDSQAFCGFWTWPIGPVSEFMCSTWCSVSVFFFSCCCVTTRRLGSFWMFGGTEFTSKCRRFWNVGPCQRFEG